METIEIKIQRLIGNDDLPLPKYMTPGSSGMDLFAAVEKTVTIRPKDFDIIPLGIKIALPEGFEAQIRPRSGLAAKYGIGLLNSPGTIDSDYRGEIKVILFNFSNEPFVVNRGDRIAQMVISQVVKANLLEYDKLEDTERSDGGFGHTGI
ncbi:MAG: dUTP diphosphatase [bacterium]